MKRQRRNSGFTMMELLIVVAIIAILAGVGFIAVQSYQRSVKGLEVDAVAKEIFIAAQNHLTLAQGEDYLGLAPSDAPGGGKTMPFGEQDDTEKDQEIYYIVVNADAFKTDSATSQFLNMVLPYGSIDEVVRTGGNYIIRYQKNTGIILDVFFCETADANARFGRKLVSGDYTVLLSKRAEVDANGNVTKDDKKKDRLNYEGAVIGWYGGGQAASIAHVNLSAPQIEIINGAKLLVKITDPNISGSENEKKSTLQLIITGKTSGTVKTVTLRAKGIDVVTATDPRISTDKYTYILDDITSAGLHFAELDAGFIPGENITVQAKVYHEEALANIAFSNVETTNSLFEKLELDTTVDASAKKLNKVSINNIRHLENLDKNISQFDPFGNNKGTSYGTGNDDAKKPEDVTAIAVTHAVQTTDISWDDFNPKTIVNKNKEVSTSFVPVKLDYVLDYNGFVEKAHSIKGITVNTTGNAGLFSEIPSGCKVSNLALIDFSITSTGGDAGALAGTLTQSEALGDGVSNVSNVVAYNSNSSDANKIVGSGSTGGLIGSVTSGLIGSVTGGYAKIEKSAAALLVQSTGGNAGGLIGTIDGGTVTACYSGGHTDHGSYYEYDDSKKAPDYTKPQYNVVATTGIAGGLIGNAGATAIVQSYSTCSVKGTIAGGFVGNTTAAANTISGCYATGLVEGTTRGAFAVLLDSTLDPTWTAQNCQYYDIINEMMVVKRGDKEIPIEKANKQTTDTLVAYAYMPPVVSSTGEEVKNAGVKALDENAEEYEKFVHGPIGQTNPNDNWEKAFVYDSELRRFYHVTGSGIDEDRFTLKTVEELGASVNKAHVDATDTTPAAPRDFVSDHYGDWPAPEIFVFNTKTTP